MKKYQQITLIIALATGIPAMAAMEFSDSLINALGSNLEIVDNAGPNNIVTFSATGANFSTTVIGNDSRNYIRTVDGDYMSGSFAAEVTWNGLGSAFLGIGGGYVGTYGTPDWDVADSLWVELANTSDTGPVQGTNPGRFSSNIVAFDNPVIGGNTSTPVRFRIEYDASANTVTFLADNNYNGTFAADAQTTAIDIGTIGGGNYFTEPGDESHFFFGGGTFGATSPTYSDFQVTAIPEPSSILMALMGFGLVGLAVRRRK